MIYEEITVPIPKRKRIRKSGGPKYVYEVLARKGRYSDKDIVSFVGVQIDDEFMHPNEKYFELHPERDSEKPLDEVTQFDKQVHLGAPLVLRKIAKREGLDAALKESFPGYDELMMTLLEYYLFRRESASQLYKYYLYDHYTELNYIPSESKLSRFFTEYLSHERISAFLEKWMEYRCSRLPNGSAIDIAFDSTSFNISSGHVLSAEYGKAKVDEGLPQVNVAYFLDRKSGIPIYFDLYYGSIIDMSHCQVALEKIKAVKHDLKGSFVMDRGYFCSENIEYMSDSGYLFMCMGKSGRMLDKLIAANPRDNLCMAQNRIYNTIYGLKFKGKPFEKSRNEYFLYLYYNEGDVATLAAAKQDSIEYISKHLAGKKDDKRRIRNTYEKMINIAVDEDDVITESSIRYEYLDNYRKECGYFWIISNEDLSLDDVLTSYRHRDMIEKQFMYAKSGADLNKTYSSDDAAFEAKSFMGFLSSILRAALTVGIRPYVLQYSSETSQTVLCELDKIKAEYIKSAYVLRYALTSRQKQLLSLFDMNVTDVTDMVKTLDFTRKELNP